MNATQVRQAVVQGYKSRREVERYLPENYAVLVEMEDRIIIQGIDVAGWTLDGYVIPRLGSGLIACREYEGGDL